MTGSTNAPKIHSLLYTIEVTTNADRLTVEGEGGILTFIAEEAGTLVHVQVPSNDHAPGIVHHHFV